jgi:hypothetical protein
MANVGVETGAEDLERAARAARASAAPVELSPLLARGLLLAVIVVALGAGFLVTDPRATAHALDIGGDDLARLLRGMAAIKMAMAGVVMAAVLWRLGSPASPVRFALYAIGCGAMAISPGVIWGLVHVSAGALLLHGGLLTTSLLVWRDPATVGRLKALVAARRRPA